MNAHNYTPFRLVSSLRTTRSLFGILRLYKNYQLQFVCNLSRQKGIKAYPYKFEPYYVNLSSVNYVMVLYQALHERFHENIFGIL